MNIDDIQLGLVRYRIDRLLVTCTGVTDYIIQNSNIDKITIQKEFDDRFFPLFTMTIGVPGWVARAMRKSTGNIKIFVDMKSGRFKNSALDVSEKPVFTSYISKSFYGIIDDSSIDALEDIQDNIAKLNGSYNKGQDYSDIQYMRVLLYNEAYLNGSRVIYNNILSSSTLINAAVLVLNKAGISNVLMSPPTNSSSFSPFIITPISAVDQLDRICNDYAIHSGGTIIFFDLDKVYIINKSTTCTAFVPNEYKIVYLSSLLKSGTSTAGASGCYSNSKDKYHLINIDTRGLASVSNTDLNDKIFGNNFSIIDSKTGQVTSASGGASKISGITQYLISNSGGNTTNAIKQGLKESNKIINIPCTYVDLSILTPNKEFIVSLDSGTFAKFNGKVRLSAYTCIFSKEGEYYIPNVVATFKG